MIAAVSLMRRLETVPLARFRRHWLDLHGPLVCSFAGLRRYVQCHVIDSPATNAAARALHIDGFPILFFDTDADRRLAHGSPAMAACNIDSRQFIGAVSRVICDAEPVMPPPVAASRLSLIALSPSGQPAPRPHLPRLLGLTRFHVRQQGPAPASTVPHLAVTVGGIAQAWVGSLVELEAAAEAWPDPQPALFAVEEHELPPVSSA